MKRTYMPLILAAATTLFSGCQSFTNYVVATGQPDAEEAAHPHACKANLARTADGQSAGHLVVRPGTSASTSKASLPACHLQPS